VCADGIKIAQRNRCSISSTINLLRP
jgi:hypothetical protein